MEENRKLIDDLFKEELGGYTETPPPAAWDALEKRLDKIPQPGFRLPGRALWYPAAGALLLLLSVPLIHKVYTAHTAPAQPIAQNTVATQPAAGTAIASTQNITDNIPTSNTANNSTITNNTSASALTANGGTNSQPALTASTGSQTNTQLTAAAPINSNAASNQYNSTGATSKSNKARSNADKQRQYAHNSAARYKNTAGKTSKSNSAALPATNEGLDNNTAAGKEIVLNSNSSAIEETVIKQPAPVNPKEPAKAAVKNDSLAAGAKPAGNAEAAKKHLFASRLGGGIKAGYEGGFNNNAGKKLVIAPYITYNAGKKFSIMLQPAYKSSQLNIRVVGSPQSYYKVNAGGQTILTDSIFTYVPNSSGIVTDTFITRNYKYVETHDSIVKSTRVGGYYTELELPVLLRYNLTDKLSVYGGPDIVYSIFNTVKEDTYDSGPITAQATASSPFLKLWQAPQVPSINIPYSGTAYSSYTGPAYTNPKNTLRLGYMIGLSYQCSRRLLLDGLIQQGAAKTNVQGGYNTSTALSAPYFRFMIGYKIW